MSPWLPLPSATSSPPADSSVIHLTVVPAPPPPDPLIGWGIGAAALIVAAAVTRRRWVRASAAPSRTARILAAGLAAGLALALIESPRDWVAGGSVFIAFAVGRLIFLGAGFSVLFMGLDFLLDAAAPRRRREWLIAAVPLFAALPPCAITLAGLWEWTTVFQDGSGFEAALAGCAAGLIWWSCLPVWDARLAYVFD